MKKVILFLVLLLTLSVVLGLAGCGGSPITPPITYAIGDTGPAGGWIFYDKGSSSDGWRYLEAAPSDQSTFIQWCNSNYVDYVVTGATGIAIGTGQANTTAIVTIQGAGNYAAQLCNDLTVGGYNDWFLPSKDELDLIYKNLYLADVGGFAVYSLFWSSSEDFDTIFAWAQSFGIGSHGSQDRWAKSFSLRVRAIRAF